MDDARFLLAAVLIFAAGFLTGYSKQKPADESIRIDAQPGVECELKISKGDDSKTVVCRAMLAAAERAKGAGNE